MSDIHDLIIIESDLAMSATCSSLPPVVAQGGSPAATAWDDFFSGTIQNRHTRLAYEHAVRRFFAWLPDVPLERITPGMVGRYMNDHPGAVPTRKLHLAALRAFFDLLVTRHVIVMNPAASVRGQRHQVIEGKTPEISIEQARALIAAIRLVKTTKKDVLPNPIGLRDRAIIATLIYTAARAGAVARLRLKDLRFDGTQWSLRFTEKGGKSREIPVRHDLQLYLLEYLTVHPNWQSDSPIGPVPGEGDHPLFRSAQRRPGFIASRPMSGIDIHRVVKRRLADAGLPRHLSPHSFRVATITDLLTQGVPLEDVQNLAGHADPRTTRLYDRRQKRVTRNVVERISV